MIVFLCPLAVAGSAGLLASRGVSGDDPRRMVVRILLTAVVSVTVFLVVERGARRFLPLAALLRLNLVFPDRAPSRFSVAMRSSSIRRLQRLVAEARRSDDVVVLAEKVVTLAATLNAHDRRTRGHCERTRALADLIVDELRLSPEEANEVRWGAFLHDIGKLVVPAEILNKPGKPTTREWEILRSHPEAGARLVEPLRSFLGAGVDAVGSHHENFDGSGYPHGLQGHHLSRVARIVSVADSFEVMTTVRAYKRPMTLQAARAELAARSGTQFDPQVVRAFLNISLGRLHWKLGIAAWLAELPFVTLLPRVVAELAPAGAGGQLSQIALPGLAAASIGAMSVVPHVAAPSPSPAASVGPSDTVPQRIARGSGAPRPEGWAIDNPATVTDTVVTADAPAATRATGLEGAGGDNVGWLQRAPTVATSNGETMAETHVSVPKVATATVPVTDAVDATDTVVTTVTTTGGLIVSHHTTEVVAKILGGVASTRSSTSLATPAASGAAGAAGPVVADVGSAEASAAANLPGI